MSADIQTLVSARIELVRTLKTLVIDNLDLDLEQTEVDEDCALFGVGLGLDSIDALQLVLSVEKTFQLSLPTDDLTIYRSINTLADYISTQKGTA